MKVKKTQLRQIIKEEFEMVSASVELDAVLKKYRKQLSEGKINEEVLEEALKDDLKLLLKKYGKMALIAAVSGMVGLGVGSLAGQDTAGVAISQSAGQY